MYPPTHFVAGLFAGEIGASLNYFTHSEALIIAALALLIDLDHYLYYSCKYRTLNFTKAWQAAVIGKEKGERTALHHWPGFLIFTMTIIGLWFLSQKWALALGLAYYSHYLLDYWPVHTLQKKKWSFKLWQLNFKITTQEIILDVLLILGIICLMII